jgi:hypothetical protein
MLKLAFDIQSKPLSSSILPKALQFLSVVHRDHTLILHCLVHFEILFTAFHLDILSSANQHGQNPDQRPPEVRSLDESGI